MNNELKEQLKEKLEEIFRFENKELDFGIYRILNYKRKEIKEFIEKELIETIEEQLKLLGEEEKKKLIAKAESFKRKDSVIKYLEAVKKREGEKIKILEELEDVKEYRKIQEGLEKIKVSEDVERAIYNHLINFFSRYYDNGDFISKRRYGRGEKYVVPYDGEETLLYWANKDQYYVKTTEYFRRYTFKATPYKGSLVVNFRVVRAEEEKGNLKSEEKKFFVLGESPFELKKNELDIYFEYRALTEQEKRKFGERAKQEDINKHIIEVLKKKSGKDTKIAVLFRGENGIGKHLNKYTKRNTMDYFINKDLKGFLQRELDFYIKNEVLSFEDLQILEKEEYYDKVRLYLLEARVIRNIALKITEFLAQIEHFQKKLWEKKKFVIKTDYVFSMKTLKKLIDSKKYSYFKEKLLEIIKTNEGKEDLYNTLKFILKRSSNNIFVRNIRIIEDRVNIIFEKRFKKEVKKGKTQTEFKENLSRVKRELVDEAKKEGYKTLGLREEVEKTDKIFLNLYAPLNTVIIDGIEKPKKHDNLDYLLRVDEIYLDTKFLNLEDRFVLLEGIENIDNLVNGVIVNGENFQACNLLLNKFRGKIDLIYIDPPFKTGTDFLYKDNYQTSSWLTLMGNRISLAKKLLTKNGSFYLHLDENANYYGRELLNCIFGEKGFQREIVWNTGENISGFKTLAPNWIRQEDTILYYRPGDSNKTFNKLWMPLNAEEKIGWLDFIGEKSNLYIEKWENGKFICKNIELQKGAKPIGNVWNDIYSFQYSEPRVTESFGFQTQKPENLLRRIVQASGKPGDLILDFFAGTGTTLAVAHKLNRRYIGVEMGEQFYTFLLPRMKGVLIGKDITHLSRDVGWQGGGFFKYQCLEQYEDSLENIEFEQPQKELREFQDYFVKYMLDFETRNSQTFLNISNVEDPFNYKLRIIENYQPEDVSVDLVETFNYLLGVSVQKIKRFNDNKREYVLVFGEVNDRKVAIVWRPTKNMDFGKDKKIIEEKIKEFNPDDIYVNGDCAVKNFRQIESDFKELMFEKVK